MSQTVGSTHYQFTIYSDAPNASLNTSFDMYADTSGNDALALAILEALNNNVAWPTGVSHPVSLTKTVDSAVVYNADLTTNPPSFA